MAALLCMFFVSGCGRQVSDSEETDMSVLNWKTNGFAVSGKVADKQALWVQEFIPWTHEDLSYDEESGILQLQGQDICYGDKVYRSYLVTEPDSLVPVRCLVEIYDASVMSASVREFTLEQLGIQNEGEYLGNMDVLEDQTYAFHVLGYDRNGEEYTIVSNRIQYLYPDGESDGADVLPVYLEKGIVQKIDTRLWLSGDCFCDAQGNSYVRYGGFTELYILDREGNLLTEYKGPSEETIGDPMKTTEGDLIFPINSFQDGSNHTKLVWFDAESGQPRILAKLEQEWVKQLYGMQDNYLYYEGQNGIVKWDVFSGDRQLVFRFAENGVFDSAHIYPTMLLLSEERPPILRFYDPADSENDWLAVLSEEPVEQMGTVRLVSITEGNSRIKNCAAIVSRRNRNYLFQYEDSGNTDPEDFRTRIIAELLAGKGPDLLFVSREDMELLQRRGLLADLRTFLSEETLDKVMPGVIELGTVDGTLVGMASGISAHSLMVGKNVYRGDSWTLDDMLELMESGQLEGRIRMSGGSYYYPFAVVRTLVDYNLENSFLIDWEKGESHFEDERFIRLLQYAGRYDNDTFEGPLDARAAGGGSLMVEVSIWRPEYAVDFQGIRGAEGSHYVGFPTDGGNGSYLDASGMLVVNKNPSNPAAVSAYLECLWGSEIQAVEDTMDSYGIPVTYFPVEEIQYDEDTGTARWNGYPLTVFEDGSTSLHEVNALLAQCVPAPKTYADMERIIYEELSAYFEETGRTAEDTAKVIDNRIQVYLDENQK